MALWKAGSKKKVKHKVVEESGSQTLINAAIGWKAKLKTNQEPVISQG